MALPFCPYCMTSLNGADRCPQCGRMAQAYKAPAHHLPPGTLLGGRYALGRSLGEGGFGITYIGLDLVLGLKVAIKEYYPSSIAMRTSSSSLQVTSRYGGTEGLRSGIDSFMAEARSLARLNDQRLIVHANSFFEENGTAYIVMEYVEGVTLLKMCEARGGRMAAAELLGLIEPMFEALTALHETGLVHRDISPDNIMFTGKGELRLLDFGCAREGAGGDRTLTVMLKYDFAPIEQYTRKGQGPWTDVYALAATIYRCICGVPVPNATERLGDDPIIPPTQLGAELTPIQERGLLKALEVQPKQRLKSAAELHAALYRGVDVGPTSLNRENSARNQSEGSDAARGDGDGVRTVTPSGQGTQGKDKSNQDGNKDAKTNPIRQKQTLLVAAAIGVVVVICLAVGINVYLQGKSTPKRGINNVPIDYSDDNESDDDATSDDDESSSNDTSATSTAAKGALVTSSDDTTILDFGSFAGSDVYEFVSEINKNGYVTQRYRLVGNAEAGNQAISRYYAAMSNDFATIKGEGVSKEYGESVGAHCTDFGFTYIGSGANLTDGIRFGDSNSKQYVHILLQRITDDNTGESVVALYWPSGLTPKDYNVHYTDYA